jgi:glucosamine--fructose-6-phosphate aminotransferase (isomerizing)
VASTKAFTSQVVCLSMAAVWFSTIHGINEKKREKIITDLNSLEKDMQITIDRCKTIAVELAKKMKNVSNMFLLGKGSDECIAKEGSLKIKEMSYIHSEGYSASSLKHGPFSLLDENFPVVILNLDTEHSVKIFNCLQEVNSRKSPIIFITNDNTIKNELSCDIIYVLKNDTYASLLGLIPIQLLSYYLSVNRGINPDKPKNLAKVVTVE